MPPTLTHSDHLPEALADTVIDFLALHARTGSCRVRLYRAKDDTALIVCTDLDEDNPGPSVTNAAESCQFHAWNWAGRPVPCRFFEHYRGTSPRNPHRLSQIDDQHGEHIDEVTFGWDQPEVKSRKVARGKVWEEFALKGDGPFWKPFSIAQLKELIGV